MSYASVAVSDWYKLLQPSLGSNKGADTLSRPLI